MPVIGSFHQSWQSADDLEINSLITKTAAHNLHEKNTSLYFADCIIFPTFAVLNFVVMSRVCSVTGKVPVSGHSVSHSNIKTKRRFLPNLQTKRFFLAEEDKWITLKVSSEGLRTINKNGLYSIVKQL